MSDQTIFGNEDKPVTPATSSVDAAQFNTLLGMIVNEQGEQKYKSVEDALKGAAHAQAYISKLAQEKADLERKFQEASQHQSREAELERTLQELLAKGSHVEAPVTSVDAPKADDIASLVLKQLEARESASKAKANQSEVAAKLLEAFGAEAEKKYNDAAQELGLTVAEMNEMAAKSPKAVLKALGVGTTATKPHNVSPAGSVLNTGAFTPNQDSFVKRNTEGSRIGATTTDLKNEAARARQMVDEVHAQGKSIGDLADPKVYFSLFKK